MVVSGREYCAARADAVLMAIASQLRPSTAFGDLWLQDWGQAGLLKASAVKPVFETIDQRLIPRRLGALSARDLAGLRQVIGRILA